jgi:ABC-type dipeptide/oligopeptide/nickel transport system permease component
MLNYIARRILFMLPTVVGITFLVFLLLALSPGGIGAAAAAAGGQQDASKAAILEAYLQDRYGLNDPVLVQYVRWLHRISPVKFGTRDQFTPAGERLQSPKEIPDPPLVAWGGFSLPEAAPAPPPAAAAPSPAGGSAVGSSDDAAAVLERQRAYRRVANDALAARSRYLGAKREFESALVDYAKAAGREDWLDGKGRIVLSRVEEVPADRANTAWPKVNDAFAKMSSAWSEATGRRAVLAAAFAEKPFPEAGLPVIPGAVWVGTPDLGTAFSKSRPVSDLIADALPVTLLLNLIAFPIIYLVAIPSGILASARVGSWFDKLSGATYVALWSVPTVWAGVLAVGYLASDEYLGLFPVSGLHDRAAETWTFLPGVQANGTWQIGWLGDALWHIVLPVACLVYGGFAVLSKQTRAAMLDNFNADYVRTAKAKGVARKDVVIHHVFRNSLLPLITMFVTVFPATLAGSVVIERIFSVPGMGSLILDAISQRDRELILANTFMIACVNLTALLIADILYAVADPRVSYE